MSIIIPKEGLCNRLRVILSYLVNHPNLEIFWEKDEPICGQHFLDIFQPIENLKFIYSKPSSYIYKGYSHCLPLESFKHNYLLLKPKLEIILKLKEYLGQLGSDYDACHIRRTDHAKIAISHKCFTNDLTFFNFIRNSPKTKVYVATDNPFTQKSLKIIFGSKVIFNNGIKNIKNLRKSNLEDALIDLIICSNSSNFIGSGYSSFSSTIETLKKINYFNSIILPIINDLDK